MRNNKTHTTTKQKMKTTKPFLQPLNLVSLAAVATLLAGCESSPKNSTAAAPAPVVASAAAPAAEKKIELPTIRIKAAASEGFTDKEGHAWLPDQGFADGDTTERPDVAIANTTDPRIYQSERYSMTKFERALPNGKYTVKLHFCETYDGVTDAGQRVFTFNVAGHEFKDFDVWKKAGGFLKAYIETVPVEITDGKLVITFTENVEHPQINALEILPAN
jgi:hypothetical protein